MLHEASPWEGATQRHPNETTRRAVLFPRQDGAQGQISFVALADIASSRSMRSAMDLVFEQAERS